MSSPRLSRAALAQHLRAELPAVRRTVLAMRRAVLAAAPGAAEAIKFHVLAYYHDGAFFKSIGGNICMIEIKKNKVILSFIRGSDLPDPAGLLYGSGKHKRFVDIPDAAFTTRPEIAALIRAAAAQETW